MQLIENWRVAWRFWSLRLQAFGLSILGSLEAFPDAVYSAWASLPPSMQAHVDEDVVRWVAYAALFAVIVARFIRQPKLHERREDKGAGNERLD